MAWTLNAFWTAAWTDRNRCADPGDLNRCILRSRRRTGRCEFSARLFLRKPCSWRAVNLSSDFAAVYERSLRLAAGVDAEVPWRGSVTATVALHGLPGKMADDDLVCPPPVSTCDHPARRLALCAFHAQLSRRRGSAR